MSAATTTQPPRPLFAWPTAATNTAPRAVAVYRLWRIRWQRIIAILKRRCDGENQNLRDVCRAYSRRAVGCMNPYSTEIKFRQCRAVLLQFQCYFCHSSVVRFLRALHTLNSHRVLQLRHTRVFLHFNASCTVPSSLSRPLLRLGVGTRGVAMQSVTSCPSGECLTGSFRFAVWHWLSTSFL
jgi:hypothetical protein